MCQNSQMDRYIKSNIYKDIAQKIILLMGPRQCGKTTLSKSLYPAEDYDYLNYDAQNDRQLVADQSWDRQRKLIIFDELHKMQNWKRWLKGIYDTQGIPPQLLVTGSAKLNTFKKVGDSLAGRYFQFQLHPLDLKELCQFYEGDRDSLFEQLWCCSGFPEPFFKGQETYYKRWRKTHLDIILRQDLIDLYSVHDLRSIEQLVFLLRNRVGSSVSYSNLARDLNKDVNTIKRWLVMLEELYVIYRITPYSNKIARSLLKEPKFYFYDHNYVTSTDGSRLENLVANALLKELHYLRDIFGDEISLNYLRTKDGKEVDFLICINQKPTLMLEVKTKNGVPSKSFSHFATFLPDTKKIQIVLNLDREKSYPDGLEIRSLIPWLSTFTLSETS